MAQGKLIQSFASLINRMKDSLPKKATIVRVDHNTVDLRLGPGTGIIHNVEVMGDPDGLYPGLVVPIEWLDRAGGYLLPVVMHSGGGTVTTAGKVPSVMADNRTLRIEGGAMQVQDNSLQLRHLGFAPALADHTHPEMFAGLGWSFGSGVISSTLGSVILENEGRIRVGNGHNTIVLDSVHPNYRLWAGNTDPTLAPFSITAEGALNASGAEISGTIHAGSGEIGGWAIGPTTLASGSFKLDSQVPALLIGSAAGYMAGEGVFLGYSGSEYKLHIGNPNGSHLAWDGNTLNITGSVFASANVIGAIGGALVVSKQQGRLSSDVGTSAAQVDFGQAMAVGDYIHIKAFDVNGAAGEEVLKIVSLASGTTYNVTRDVQGANNPDPAWPKDTLWVAKGKQGDGWIEIGDFGLNRIKMRQFTGPNFTDDKEYLRLGEMTGWQGAGLTGMGLGIGDYAGNKYLSYSPVAGLTVRGSIKADSGYLGALDISGQLTVQNTGKIVMGSTTTGIVLGYQTDGHYLRGINNGTTQFEIKASDGKAYAGAGNITLDREGIWLKDTAAGAAPMINFNSGGSTGTGSIAGWRYGTSGNDFQISISAAQPSDRGSLSGSVKVNSISPYFIVAGGNPLTNYLTVGSYGNTTIAGTLNTGSTIQSGGGIIVGSNLTIWGTDMRVGYASIAGISSRNDAGWASDWQALDFYTGWNWAANRRMTINYDGYVGIGTAYPGTNFEVAGGWVTRARVTAGGSPLIDLYSTAADPGARNWCILNASNEHGELVFSQSGAQGGDPTAAGAVQRMVIKRSGSVGIGTTTPKNLLHVAGTIQAYSELKFSIEDYYGGSIPSYPHKIMCTSDWQNSANDKMQFFVANAAYWGATEAERQSCVLTLAGNGNVGIDVTSPSKRFSVSGINGWETGFNPGPSSPEVSRLFWFSDNSGWRMSIGNFYTGNGAFTIRMQVSDSGSVMIGTTTDGMTGGGSLAIAQDLAHRGSRVGFFGVTPIARPTTAYTAATFTAGGGTQVLSNSTFGGYTIGQVVKALRDIGILT